MINCEKMKLEEIYKKVFSILSDNSEREYFYLGRNIKEKHDHVLEIVFNDTFERDEVVLKVSHEVAKDILKDFEEEIENIWFSSGMNKTPPIWCRDWGDFEMYQRMNPSNLRGECVGFK